MNFYRSRILFPDIFLESCSKISHGLSIKVCGPDQYAVSQVKKKPDTHTHFGWEKWHLKSQAGVEFTRPGGDLFTV